MTIDGGPPPGDGYPDPGKYTPDNLGEKSVWSTNDRIQLLLPPAALRYLDLEEGDTVVFRKNEGEKKQVIAEKMASDDA